MQVGAGGPAGLAHSADILSLAHALAAAHVDAAQVGVDGDMLVAVLHVDHVAIAVADAGVGHHALGDGDQVALAEVLLAVLDRRRKFVGAVK